MMAEEKMAREIAEEIQKAAEQLCSFIEPMPTDEFVNHYQKLLIRGIEARNVLSTQAILSMIVLHHAAQPIERRDITTITLTAILKEAIAQTLDWLILQPPGHSTIQHLSPLHQIIQLLLRYESILVGHKTKAYTALFTLAMSNVILQNDDVSLLWILDGYSKSYSSQISHFLGIHGSTLLKNRCYRVMTYLFRSMSQIDERLPNQLEIVEYACRHDDLQLLHLYFLHTVDNLRDVFYPICQYTIFRLHCNASMSVATLQKYQQRMLVANERVSPCCKRVMPSFFKNAIDRMATYWHPTIHIDFYPLWQTTIWAMLLAARRGCGIQLPEELWSMHILPHYQQQDFLPTSWSDGVYSG
jgi:hypothetical protein